MISKNSRMIDRNAARALADYIAEANAGISQANKTAKENGDKYRLPTIKYTNGLKPAFLAHVWATGAWYEAERRARRYDTKAIH